MYYFPIFYLPRGNAEVKVYVQIKKNIHNIKTLHATLNTTVFLAYCTDVQFNSYGELGKQVPHSLRTRNSQKGQEIYAGSSEKLLLTVREESENWVGGT